jgi:hypothetical protein
MHFGESISGHLDLWLRERIDGHIDPGLSTGSGCMPTLVETIMRGFPATCTGLDNSNDGFCRNLNTMARSFLGAHLRIEVLGQVVVTTPLSATACIQSEMLGMPMRACALYMRYMRAWRLLAFTSWHMGTRLGTRLSMCACAFSKRLMVA